MDTFEDGRVRSWASMLDDGALNQAIHTSKLPVLVAPLALMPDAHLGQGATIGSVLVTEDAVIPAAVGVDIGCGMAARKLDLTEQQMTPELLAGWRGEMEARVPAGLGNWHARAHGDAEQWVDEHGIPATLAEARGDTSRVAAQLGTLGSGNHFVEISVDEAGFVWLLLHSGSRGAGNKLATVHVDQAKKLDRARAQLGVPGAPWGDLAWLESGTGEFDTYLKDLAWAQAYAMENRRLLLNGAHEALDTVFGGVGSLDEVNCHHNYAVQEYVVELGRKAFVTRKGAIRAGYADRGLIPGAMGQASFIVRGLGNALSYESCSHGAGRVMSRTAARKTIPVDSFAERMQGVVWQDADAAALLDEHPDSYKPVEQVMSDQADLVEVEHRLRAVANYKGVESRGQAQRGG